MKRSSKNSPPKPQLLSNSFSEVLQRWSSILLVPPTGFRINVIIVLPGFSKGGGRRIPCLPFWLDTRGSCLCSFGLFSLLKKKKKKGYVQVPQASCSPGQRTVLFWETPPRAWWDVGQIWTTFPQVEVWKRRGCRKRTFIKFHWETQIIHKFKESRVYYYRSLAIKKTSFSCPTFNVH